MAIETDSIVDVGTYTTFNVGISKAISNYTADEIWDYPYCSSQWEYFKHIGNFPETMWDYAPGATDEGTNLLFPLKFVGRNAAYYPQTYNFDPGEIEYNNPDGIYCKVIWLYGTDTQISNLLTGKRRSIYATDGFKIVTQMDMTKVFIFLDNFRSIPFGNNININDLNTLNYDNLKIKEDHDGTTSYSHPRNCSIFPVVMFMYNNKLHLHLLFQRLYESLDWSWGVHASQNTTRDKIQGYEWGAQPCSFDGSQGCYLPVNIARDFVGLRPQNVESFHTATDMLDVGAVYQWHYYAQTGGRINPVTEQAYLKLASWYGGMFYHNGVYYKPIIEGGYVTGYTNNMEIPSDIDNWTGATRHDVPPSPPGPAPGADTVDDMTLNPFFGLSSDAGFAAYYLLTQSQLASLHTWLTSTAFPDGYDPYSYIISLMQFPMKLTPNWCLAGYSGSIHIGGEDTGITASLIGTEQTWKGLGVFDVPRHNKNFLDFNPYSQYEVYIPCCGWITVPDVVAGRQINVRINYDLTDGTIIGNVFVKINGNWLLIGSKSGMMGRQTVISGEAQGVKNAQVTSALLSAGTGALNVATGIMSQNAVAAVSGGYNIVSGLAQANIAGNSSYVRQIGSTGGRSLLCQYDKCYLKCTTSAADIPENYGHTVGYICNLKGKVSDFRGYTVFSNVDTSGISGATERERQMIKRILESGVIINAAPSP